MKGADGPILYIGKAKNLRNRLTSYFQPAGPEVQRTQILVGLVERFDVILTETEQEALLLEATLVRKHRPRFNVRLKDDKSFPYLKVSMPEASGPGAFPRLEWTRRVRRGEARYFGPFPSAYSARQVLKLLNHSLRLRDCSDNTFSHRSRPCILFEMDQCSAPCVHRVSPEEYHQQMQRAERVLEGKDKSWVDVLESKMHAAAAEQNFELAAQCRDQLQALRLVTETQIAVEATRGVSRDILGLARDSGVVQGTVLHVRQGVLVGVHHATLQNADPEASTASLLRDFCSQYYTPQGEAYDEGVTSVLVREAPAELGLLEKTLQKAFFVPESGEDQRLLTMAETNAEYALKALRKGEGHGLRALEEVQDRLQLEDVPHRIECYDISNLQGGDAVGSRVTFIDGEPVKDFYRRYKIRTVEGSNDFAMMKEVLSRRFSKRAEDDAWPDLVLLDGGKGQLAQGVRVFSDLGIQGVALASLAKARTERDFESSEVKGSSERVFLPGRKNPVVLAPHTRAFKLLTHLRDEAHRFAITYHRKVRAKRISGD